MFQISLKTKIHFNPCRGIEEENPIYVKQCEKLLQEFDPPAQKEIPKTNETAA